MNGINCSSLCHLLCCPPLPSRIAAKLAFLPPEPSYTVIKENEKSVLSFASGPYSNEFLPNFSMDKVEVFTAPTRKGNTIVMLYMQTNPATKLTFLLSHGNAVDIGLMLTFMHDLSCKLGVNVMCYDYSGYGGSTGKPLEKHLYADAECAIEHLQKRFLVPLEQIVLYGQSIGTVPTVYLATRYRVAAVVLHSPLMSGLRVAFPKMKRNYCCDVFPNLLRTPRVISPTLIIHGTCDDVIGINHGQTLYASLPESVVLEPLFVTGGGHNDCEMYPQYLMRLLDLVHRELPHLVDRARTESIAKVNPGALKTVGIFNYNSKSNKKSIKIPKILLQSTSGDEFDADLASNAVFNNDTKQINTKCGVDVASISSSTSSELSPMLGSQLISRQTTETKADISTTLTKSELGHDSNLSVVRLQCIDNINDSSKDISNSKKEIAVDLHQICAVSENFKNEADISSTVVENNHAHVFPMTMSCSFDKELNSVNSAPKLPSSQVPVSTSSLTSTEKAEDLNDTFVDKDIPNDKPTSEKTQRKRPNCSDSLFLSEKHSAIRIPNGIDLPPPPPPPPGLSTASGGSTIGSNNSILPSLKSQDSTIVIGSISAQSFFSNFGMPATAVKNENCALISDINNSVTVSELGNVIEPVMNGHNEHSTSLELSKIEDFGNKYIEQTADNSHCALVDSGKKEISILSVSDVQLQSASDQQSSHLLA